MSVAIARIATACAGFCDTCYQPFTDSEIVHEFVFASRGDSFVVQFATCARCHAHSRQERAVSAPPTRALVFACRYHNSATMDCTPQVSEFLSQAATKVRFEDGVAA